MNYYDLSVKGEASLMLRTIIDLRIGEEYYLFTRTLKDTQLLSEGQEVKVKDFILLDILADDEEIMNIASDEWELLQKAYMELKELESRLSSKIVTQIKRDPWVIYSVAMVDYVHGDEVEYERLFITPVYDFINRSIRVNYGE